MIVLWRVTERCNLACGFCAYDRRLPGARREVDASMVRRFGEVLGIYQKETSERVLLSWLGGEPMLWRPLFETSRWLRSEHGIATSATTNGSTLHLAQTVEGVIDALEELTISIDGLASFHDAVRGCAGAWQRLRKSVKSLAQARDASGATLKLRINTVLMRDNLGEFAALCAELAEWGVDEITFNQLGGRDRPEFFPSHSLRPQDVLDLRAMLPELRAMLAQRGVRLCGSDSYLRRIEASAGHRELAIADCGPGERFLFIDETGQVSPCGFTGPSYGVPIEMLRNARDLIDLPARYRAAKSRTRAKICDDCPSTHVFAKFAG